VRICTIRYRLSAHNRVAKGRACGACSTCHVDPFAPVADAELGTTHAPVGTVLAVADGAWLLVGGLAVASSRGATRVAARPVGRLTRGPLGGGPLCSRGLGHGRGGRGRRGGRSGRGWGRGRSGWSWCRATVRVATTTTAKVQVHALLVWLAWRDMLRGPRPTQHLPATHTRRQLNIPRARVTRRSAVHLLRKWGRFVREINVQQRDGTRANVGRRGGQAKVERLSRRHAGDLTSGLATANALAVGRLEIIHLVRGLFDATWWRGGKVAVGCCLHGKRREK
jgi:hypothetical protein